MYMQYHGTQLCRDAERWRSCKAGTSPMLQGESQNSTRLQGLQGLQDDETTHGSSGFLESKADAGHALRSRDCNPPWFISQALTV